MRILLVVGAVVLLGSGSAWASECRDWGDLSVAQKGADIRDTIEGHLNSNVGKRYTSENVVDMRLCLERYVTELRLQFDAICVERNPPMDALDQLFDRYFLSCIQ